MPDEDLWKSPGLTQGCRAIEEESSIVASSAKEQQVKYSVTKNFKFGGPRNMALLVKVTEPLATPALVPLKTSCVQMLMHVKSGKAQSHPVCLKMGCRPWYLTETPKSVANRPHVATYCEANKD
ncbi:hypothetical protein TNCV_3392311 [Trichonephila clavipes]|nr:hypothetical protein TNCV_3392311 [Trichonephila clavipes]